MNSQTLANFLRGMDRQRLRATPKQGTFYNLLNCYVTPSGTIKKRPGFRKLGGLDATTRGLFSNNGTLHAFYTGTPRSTPASLPVEYDALQPDVDGATLTKVWADYLFLGRQYVAAEFSDGNVYHFWLPSSGTSGSAPAWQADHNYNVNDRVQPINPNGFFYTIANNQFPQAWQPNTQYVVGDVVVPSTLNGWKYTVIEADGATPSSGSTEPDWPVTNGATISEEHNEAPPAPAPPAAPPPAQGGGRYGNLGGGSGGAIQIGQGRSLGIEER